MIDFARITVRAGDGGNGAGSFRRIKGKRYGKADGGDGGNGGNVFLAASRDLNTLEPFRYVKDYKAENGRGGLSNNRYGADEEDLVLKVPVGTVVIVAGPVNSFPLASARSRLKSKLDQRDHVELRAVGSPSTVATRYDLIEHGQKTLIARGGEGGRGNAKLRDDFGRRPRAGELGEKGEILSLTLELKLIADVGLIGLPNSGKSTLLAALTAAKPAIAPYPFTTLEPNLGVLNSSQKDKTVNREQITENQSAKLIIADIPGLIEGSSEGRGLGDLFLRHIERTQILVHLIDVSSVSNKWHDYQIVRNELKSSSKELTKKKEIIVLTKADLVSFPTWEKVKKKFSARRKKVILISAKTGEGLPELVKAIYRV